MSKATKKRIVFRQMETELVLPESNQMIAQVLGSRGNNLLEVTDEKGDTYLASMPTKFRKNVWVKRGQFVVLEAIEEGDKVKAEIANVLDNESVVHIVENNRWPKCFEADADKLSRSRRRNLPDGSSGPIDPDMLPPSDSEEDEESLDEDEMDEDECEDDEEDGIDAVASANDVKSSRS